MSSAAIFVWTFRVKTLINRSGVIWEGKFLSYNSINIEIIVLITP